MSSIKRIFLGVATTFLTVATGFSQYDSSSRSSNSNRPSDGQRNGYSYVRETVAGVTVQSRWNGRVTARRNMPISAGDEILTSEAGRAEVGLADGNLLFVGGGTRARFSSLNDQQGENDEFSAIDLRDGSVVLARMGAGEESVPRIDTEDATVYLSAGSRVRVNADPRRGTVVVVRAGSAEVRTRSDNYTLDAGQYLMVQGDETPDIWRGVFSRDRFDLWCADRLEGLTSETTRSVSARYVDDDYASDVVALDGYGDWEYNSTYSTNVWVPRVDINWTPYSYGSWYYTPIGLTWWSSDPWGWYPFHYGSWFFDLGFHHWCWAPSYTYSPAWVYWAYTPNYVGWCPVGSYSFYSPWFNNYYRSWGWTGGHSRAQNLVFALSGTFKTAKVDFGGWNFVAARSLGTTSDRLSVVSGSRIASALGDQIAISAKPIVVASRGDSVSQAIQNYVKEAPARIERTQSRDATRLAPVLAREKSLPPSTLDALQERAVVTGRGRIAGPGSEELASRGMRVERGRSVTEFLGSRGAAEKGAVDRGSAFARGRKAGEAPVVLGDTAREAPTAAGPRKEDAWRGRGRDIGRAPAPEPGVGREDRGRGRPEIAPPDGRRPERSAPAPAAEDWRQRAPESKREAPRPPTDRPAPAPSEFDRPKPAKSVSPEEAWRGRPESRSVAPRLESRAPEVRWRTRSDVPPARRVIEGAVPSRRWQGETEVAPRGQRGPERAAPASREYRPDPREFRAPAPPAREYRPDPREYRAPAPPARAREYSAPPSRPAAPASGDKGNGKNHKG